MEKHLIICRSNVEVRDVSNSFLKLIALAGAIKLQGTGEVEYQDYRAPSVFVVTTDDERYEFINSEIFRDQYWNAYELDPNFTTERCAYDEYLHNGNWFRNTLAWYANQVL